MANTYVDTQTNGDTTTKITYTCGKNSMEYTIIGDNIKEDFNFLLPSGELAAKLDEMLKEVQDAASITDAFLFEGSGGNEKDIQEAYEKIKEDVNSLKLSLQDLHSAFMTDIDNVNAELKVNFGHWIGYKVNEAGREVTTNTTTNP